jgi:hypothetical protein
MYCTSRQCSSIQGNALHFVVLTGAGHSVEIASLAAQAPVACSSSPDRGVAGEVWSACAASTNSGDSCQGGLQQLPAAARSGDNLASGLCLLVPSAVHTGIVIMAVAQPGACHCLAAAIKKRIFFSFLAVSRSHVMS